MKGVAAAMAGLSQSEIGELETAGVLNITVEGQPVAVEAADLEIYSEDIPGWLVANEGNITVALEVELNEELLMEGMARELINRVQNLRKDGGLEITDRVNVTVSPNAEMEKAMAAFGEYVQNQVLADQIAFAENDGQEVNFDDFNLRIRVEKV